MSQYLRAFIIGSSYPAFILYFNAVSKYDESKMRYTYRQYTMIAPVYLGILNVLGLYIANSYNLSRLQRFTLVALIGSIVISTFITIFKIYDFEYDDMWYQQYLGLIIVYVFVFCVIINCVDMYM